LIIVVVVTATIVFVFVGIATLGEDEAMRHDVVFGDAIHLCNYRLMWSSYIHRCLRVKIC